jgi:hypothetical protein
MTEIYTKESLIKKLKEIREQGFIESGRHGNHGGIGNTLEDLLGIEENNLPLPNAAEWELKAARIKGTSLTTLLHVEPSPRALKLVVSTLLPFYGWAHKEAGKRHPEHFLSFRQTINGLNRTDRGFKVVIDEVERKVLISFDSSAVAIKHADWLRTVEARAENLGELNPQPYWGFDDLHHALGAKLTNCFYIQAAVKKINGQEFYHYQSIKKLVRFDFEKFLQAMRDGLVLVDFDARTSKNHGTKFRLKQNYLQNLYDEVEEI